MDKAKVSEMHSELNSFLKEFGKKYNLSLIKDNCTYTDTNFDFKISFRASDTESGLMINKDAEHKVAYDVRLVHGKDIKGKFMGREISVRGLGDVTLVDFSSRSKNKYIVETSAGTKYKVPFESITSWELN